MHKTYDNIHEYALAIEAEGEHAATIGREKYVTTDGHIFKAKGGRGYSVAECAYDQRMIEAILRTAAMRMKAGR